jgi:hypothetical protein
MGCACELSPQTRLGWVSAAISVVRSRALRKAERNEAHSKQNDFNLSACRHDFQRIGLSLSFLAAVAAVSAYIRSQDLLRYDVIITQYNIT